MEFSRELASGPQELIEALQDVGLDTYIELPSLAVMGDTSAGKSSVLSAVAHIEFPKSADITTRCPTQLVLKKMTAPPTDVEATINGGSHGGGKKGKKNKNATAMTTTTDQPTFHAKVNVKWKDPLWEEDDTKRPREWQPRECSTVEELTDLMAEAQEHIMEATGSTRAAAADVIDIAIHSTTVSHELTLIDLPGFVRSTADNEDKDLGKKIDSMVNSFLKNDRCIIVAVHAANVQFRNSSILQNAKDADTNQERTLVVVTKPDLVDQGAEKDVIKLLSNEEISFKHGFHVVRSRSQKDLDSDVTIQQARDNEMEFFRNNAPWDRLEKDIVGVQRLQHRLSDMQKDTIKRQLPSITDDVKQRLAKAKGKLKLFPEVKTPMERRSTLRGVFTKLKSSLGELTERGPQLRRVIADRKKDFAVELLTFNICRDKIKMATKYADGTYYCSAAPVRVPELQVGQATRSRPETGTVTNGSRVLHLTTGHTLYVLRVVQTEDPLAEKKYRVYDTNSRSYPTVNRSEFEVDVSDDMLEAVRNHQVRGLNATVDERLIAGLVDEFITNHLEPVTSKLAQDCSTIAEKIVKDAARDALQSMMDLFSNMISLPARIDAIMEKRGQFLTNELGTIVKEQTVPHTQNHYFQSQLAKMRTASLKAKFLSHLNESITPELVEGIFAETESLSNDEYVARDATYILDAYWKVASKRLGDTIPERIDQVLTRDLADEVYGVFEELTDGELEHLFATSPEVERKREKLRKEVDTLEASLRVILHCAAGASHVANTLAS